MNKESFRQEAIRVRDNIEVAADDADSAAANFLEAIAPQPGQVVALYWPKGREFDTLPLMHELLQRGITCALPVIQKGERLLKFSAYQDGNAMEEGPFKVIQPKIDEQTIWTDPDIFVVPLLAFDRHGNRMGYGMGHYDATLKHYRAIKPVIAVGYAYGQQAVLFNLPAEPHDEKLDWVVTPQKAQRFKV
ncbi:MAG: 5-formyltetrahydrofolate cyclo-ligase [Micavibrio sp.]|nr:5-formyltetrahydrofolate cyclo-ligase [Micavibrio sp.]